MSLSGTQSPSQLPAYRELPEAVLTCLGVDPALGLTTAEASARLRQYGWNELASPPAWRRLVATVVTATGKQTEMGKIAGLLQRTEDAATPLQTEIERVGRALGAAVILIAVVIIAAVFLTQRVTTVKAVVDVRIVGVSLAVAAVLEGLATVLTIVLALGMQRMARRNAIVRKLAGVETLGSANVICTGALSLGDWLVCIAVASSVIWTCGLFKFVMRCM